MIPIADFQRRSLTGPVMKEQEFDMSFARKIRGIVSRYGLKYNPEQIIADDATADATFHAGVDLLAEVGLYNRDTQRVIQFTKEEIEELARERWNGTRSEWFGKGKDHVTIRYRTAEDPRPPVIFSGPEATTSTEELYIPYIQSFIQEELTELCCGVPSLVSYQGVENKTGTAGELFVTRAEIELSREAARRAGRPDIYLGKGSAASPGAVVSLWYEGGFERHNHMPPIHIMPEQKLDWSRLMIALAAEQHGMVPWTSAISIIGALCRNAEDAAVGVTANLLGQLAYGHGNIGLVTVVDLVGSSTTLPVMWAYSAAARASERNIGIPLGGGVQSIAGMSTEIALYEKCGPTISHVASGAAWVWYEACRGGRTDNNTSGLEGRLKAETAHAVAGMKAAEANDLILKIYALYGEQLKSAPEGKSFGELYDVKKVQPTAEYMDVYKRAKDQLAKLGVPFKK